MMICHANGSDQRYFRPVAWMATSGQGSGQLFSAIYCAIISRCTVKTCEMFRAARPLLRSPGVPAGFSVRAVVSMSSKQAGAPISMVLAGDSTTERVKVNARGEEYAATVRSVPVQVARELLNAGHRYLDVRTAEEFAAGHIEGAINVPYMHKVGSGMSKNLSFVDDVRRHFHKDSEVVVGCKTGRRSLMAAHEMEAAGDFTGVTDMVGGYDAWVESGLPVKVLQA